MKKLFAVALALAMLLSVAAFAETADYLGVWYLNEIDLAGAKMSPAMLGMEMTFDFQADGTVIVTSPGEEGEPESMEAAWTLEGETLTVTVEDEPMAFVLVDGNLVADSGDGMVMTCGREKEEAEAYVPGAPKADAAQADYLGTWTASQINMEGAYMPADLFGLNFTATIDEAAITLDGGLLFSGDVLPVVFADGALSFTAEDPDSVMYASAVAQLLDDDTLSLALGAEGEGVEFILVRAE